MVRHYGELKPGQVAEPHDVLSRSQTRRRLDCVTLQLSPAPGSTHAITAQLQLTETDHSNIYDIQGKPKN